MPSGEISLLVQVLYRMIYLGQTVKEAVDARRLHHQLVPMEIKYEDGVTRVSRRRSRLYDIC